MGQVLLLLVVALTVGAVVFGVTVLVTGRDPGLVPVEPDGSSAPLPGGRPLREADVGEVRFDTALRGYRMDQVDQALSRAAYDIGYKTELIEVLEAEVAALRDGRTEEADALRRTRDRAIEQPAVQPVTTTDAAQPGQTAAPDAPQPVPTTAADAAQPASPVAPDAAQPVPTTTATAAAADADADAAQPVPATAAAADDVKAPGVDGPASTVDDAGTVAPAAVGTNDGRPTAADDVEPAPATADPGERSGPGSADDGPVQAGTGRPDPAGRSESL